MVNPFLKTKTFEELQQALADGRGPIAVTGTVDPVKAQLLVSLDSAANVSAKRAGAKTQKNWKLLVVKDEQSGKRFVKDIHAFDENAWYYPAKDFLFYQADTQGNLITRQRVEVLKHLMEDDGGVIVAGIDALMDKVLGKENFSESVLSIRPGMVMEMEALSQKLSNLGYERMAEVEAMGEYGNHFSKVQRHLLEAVSLAEHNEKELAGIVLNAFTEPFVLSSEIWDIVKNMKSRIEE